METKEMSYNELVINGFMALFFNLVMLPALVFLNFLIFGQLPWLSIPVLFMLVLLFMLMLPGYFSQEPNEARVMVFFGEYKGTFKNTGFFWVNPFMNAPLPVWLFPLRLPFPMPQWFDSVLQYQPHIPQ